MRRLQPRVVRHSPGYNYGRIKLLPRLSKASLPPRWDDDVARGRGLYRCVVSQREAGGSYPAVSPLPRHRLLATYLPIGGLMSFKWSWVIDDLWFRSLPLWGFRRLAVILKGARLIGLLAHDFNFDRYYLFPHWRWWRIRFLAARACLFTFFTRLGIWHCGPGGFFFVSGRAHFGLPRHSLRSWGHITHSRRTGAKSDSCSDDCWYWRR